VSEALRAGERARTAEEVIQRLGGRYSSGLGIDVDAGEGEVERWLLAATLFGTRISAAIAARTFHVFDESGIHRLHDVASRSWDDLVALLDAGGYARYDFRTASRLQELEKAITERYGDVASIGRNVTDPVSLVKSLDTLPGWGPMTIQLFLRELRGVWSGAQLPLDPRAISAARHLGLFEPRDRDELITASHLAREIGQDVRDLEGGLVRLNLAHRAWERGHHAPCPGGRRCVVLERASTPSRD
jgi:hypothetical protein